MKRSLQQIEDEYVNQGYRGEKLRQALAKDSEYKKLLFEKKKKLSKTFEIGQSEARKYVLSTNDDFEILAKCKQLEKLNLSDADKAHVKLIKTQLENDWRKPLFETLDKLLKKYQ